jgi:putative ABC transport system ATP-binding protein
MLKLERITKSYFTPEGELPIIRDLSVEIAYGNFVAVMGPSGSGKSTFLGIAAGLDRPNSGRIILDGEDISQKTEDQLSVVRSLKIGFIFQNFQLIKNLTALENVCLPLIISGRFKDKEIINRAEELLIKVSLKDRMNHLPSQLSGGEEQRVAIARAFINNPKILFADEPTGNLDARNGEIVMRMLLDLNKTLGSTLIIVTHDPGVSMYANKVLEMREGKLYDKTLIKENITKSVIPQTQPTIKEKNLSTKKKSISKSITKPISKKKSKVK